MNTTLPQDSQLRKEYPLYRGLWRYFPAALAGVAGHSKAGNDKHNPGEEMHHARGKSNDHEDCILRHLMDLSDMLEFFERHGEPIELRGLRDIDAVSFASAGSISCDELRQRILDEANALVWRACALSQILHERIGGAPRAPGAKD